MKIVDNSITRKPEFYIKVIRASIETIKNIVRNTDRASMSTDNRRRIKGKYDLYVLLK